MLARLLRSLSAAALVFLTSVALVVAPSPASAFEVPPDGAARTVARTAAKVGTRAAPLRWMTCGSIPGLIACSAAAGGMYWLSETDSGRQFGGDVLDAIGLDGDWWRGDVGTDGRQCQATVEPVAWAQHQVSFSVDVEGTYSETYDCYGAWMERLRYAEDAGNLAADCITATGQLYRSVGNLLEGNGLFSACNNASTDWLIGVKVTSGTSTRMATANPAYYKNPIWNGEPGANPDWWNDNIAKPVTTARITCRNTDGTEYTKSVTVAGVATADPALSCDAGGTVVGRKASVSAFGGIIRTLYDVAVDAAAKAQYPECTSGGAYCDMAVLIDGVLCEYGRAGCADWWDVAQTSPNRVSCSWGPYTLGYGDCRELRNAYVTPDGAWSPSDLDPGAVPIPYYPTDPTYRPAPPVGNGADPSWINPAQCPPAPGSFFAGTSEYGLQPIAVQALRCFAMDHGDFRLTSGFRSTDHSAWYSDHPHGLALDLAPPAWDTPAGNQRGWDAVAYWIWNSPALGVRYIIFDGAIWWPQSGWHVYEGPSPHRDHVHVSLDPHAAPDATRTLSPSPTVPYPQPTPNPDPAPPTNPDPTAPVPNPTDPNPDPTTPTWPDTGTSPTDPDGCLSTSWTWDPVSWVAAPVKCSLLWAFVPTPETVTQVQADVADGVGATGVTTWVDVVGSIPDALDADESVASCRGPGMAFPEPIGTVYVLDACSGIRATLAAACKTIAGASIAVGAVLSCLSLVSRAIGYDTALSTVTAPLAAPAPGDAAASASAASSGGMTFSAADMRLARASARVTERMRHKS